MTLLPPSSLRLSLLLVSVFWLPFWGMAQSQGQAGEELLEFQSTNKRDRTVVVKAGDPIRFPLGGEGRFYEEKGRVRSWTDSTIVIASEANGDLHELSWEGTPYLILTHMDYKVAGWVLLGLGILSVVASFVGAIVFIGLYSSAAISLTVLIPLLVLMVLNPLNWLGLGLGSLFRRKSMQKVSRPAWSYRRIQRMIVRKAAP